MPDGFCNSRACPMCTPFASYQTVTCEAASGGDECREATGLSIIVIIIMIEQSEYCVRGHRWRQARVRRRGRRAARNRASVMAYACRPVNGQAAAAEETPRRAAVLCRRCPDIFVIPFS